MSWFYFLVGVNYKPYFIQAMLFRVIKVPCFETFAKHLYNLYLVLSSLKYGLPADSSAQLLNNLKVCNDMLI